MKQETSKLTARKILKMLIVTLAIIISCSTVQAKDIQLLNPDFFGQPTSNAIKLLYDKKSDEGEPYNVTADIKCGIYYAASVFYSNNTTFNEARESLSKLYKSYEILSLLQKNKIAVWRVENRGFSVQLTQEEDHIRINYIRYESMGANADCFRN
jgi:hypothetical protein